MAVDVFRITESAFYRLLEDGETYRILELVNEGIPLIQPQGIGDITKSWQAPLGYADYALVGAVLAAGANLETAILNSLFSDRLALPSDSIPDGTSNRRGWWADNKLGSRIWLLDRAKLLPSTPLQLQGYITEALQWMLDDGVAIQINVQTALQLPSGLAAMVEIYRQNGQRIAPSFAWVWGVN